MPDAETHEATLLASIGAQIHGARADLAAYRPTPLDWFDRATKTANEMVPWLAKNAPALKAYVQDVLNAPTEMRKMWAAIRPLVKLPETQLLAFDRQLELDQVTRESITGETVSAIVTKYLVDAFADEGLLTNGRSDYPDLYLKSRDYSALPSFNRKAKVDDEFGAALKGPLKRPVRVPDGLEVKTCRDRIAVDCHHPHAGLHLVLVFSESARIFAVQDVRVAFLCKADYRESERNTTATTVKYSFNGDRFVSLFPVS